MIETRIVKIVMVGSLALFAGLVAYNNLTDYQTNYVFVRHVLSMDTTPGNALMYRSISSPSLWEAAYALIIAGEGATALGFAGAAALLLRHLHSPAASFNRAKGLTAVAAGLGFLVWFFGFMVIGGVVSDVAIVAMERPATGLSLLSDNPGRADLCHTKGRIGCCRDELSGL